MARLNQLIAVEKGVKSSSENAITEAYRTLQRSELFSGLTRTYEPKDDEGDRFPSEHQKVQTTVKDVVDRFIGSQTALMDVTATKTYANTGARADVKVGDTVILKDVPVEFLLFLEKRLALTAEFLSKVPTLSPELNWTLQESDGLYHSDPVQTNKTKKVFRNHVKAEATDKHPAQVETYTEDEIIGQWTNVRLSGATTASQIAEWRERLGALQQAVKFAREEANSIEVEQQKIGEAVFDYLFN